MRQVYRFDENGFFKEPVFINDDENIPWDCTEIKPSNKLYSPKFVKGEWVNGISDEEIEKIRNPVIPLSEVQQLQQENANLMFQNAIQDVNIGKQESNISNLQKENADLLYKIAMLEVNANV